MLTVVALVVGTVAAIGLTQSFRNEGTVISGVSAKREASFPPGRSCPAAERGPGIPISFFLNRDDTVDLAIVNAEDGGIRRTLATGLRLEGGSRHCAPWDGLDDSGQPVPEGAYRLRVTLEEADRVAIAGERIRVNGGSRRREGGR